MHQEGSRYAGDEWVTEVVAACRMASEGEESYTGTERRKVSKIWVHRHILQVGPELGRWARNRRGQLCLLCYWAARLGKTGNCSALEVLRLYASLLSGNKCEGAAKV